LTFAWFLLGAGENLSTRQDLDPKESFIIYQGRNGAEIADVV
jgi:hypothetical protein